MLYLPVYKYLKSKKTDKKLNIANGNVIMRVTQIILK